MQGKDDTHTLVVDSGGMYVEHQESCAKEEFLDGLDNHEPMEYYVCPVGRHVSMWGYDDLVDQNGTDADHLQPGRYKLILSWYDSGSMFEDAEVNFWVEV